MDEKAEIESVLKHLSVLRIEPGDKLVLRLPGMISVAGAERLRQSLDLIFSPGTPVLILEGGAELGVVRFAAPDPGG